MDRQQAEHVEVHAAPPHLRAWSPCVILRRVDSVRPVSARVHANTFACLNVVVRGTVDVGGQRPPARFVTGPLAQPRETSSRDALASASLVLEPWLVEPWLGMRVDRLSDALPPPPLLASRVCDALAAACHDPGALDAMWLAFEAAVRASGARPPDLALEVLLAEGVEAAAAAVGCSARHYRRRFQRALGLAPAAWVRVRRWEVSLEALLAADARDALATVAAAAGYADQAHLSRETRAFVRGTPAQLRATAAAGAAAWSLAPARVRILQDGEAGGP